MYEFRFTLISDPTDEFANSQNTSTLTQFITWSLEQVKPSITFAKVQVRDTGLRSCSIRAGGDTLGIGVTIDDFRRAGMCPSPRDWL